MDRPCMRMHHAIYLAQGGQWARSFCHCEVILSQQEDVLNLFDAHSACLWCFDSIAPSLQSLKHLLVPGQSQFHNISQRSHNLWLNETMRFSWETKTRRCVQDQQRRWFYSQCLAAKLVTWLQWKDCPLQYVLLVSMILLKGNHQVDGKWKQHTVKNNEKHIAAEEN